MNDLDAVAELTSRPSAFESRRMIPCQNNKL